MWRLIVLRHAKSAWPDVRDVERPLAARGLRDAPAAGRWLLDHELVPDHAICSPARRAAETWELASAEWPEAPPVVHDPRVYEADANGLVDVLRTVSPTAGTVLLVGHQPVLAELVLALADRDPGAPAPRPVTRTSTGSGRSSPPAPSQCSRRPRPGRGCARGRPG
ncbi:SixA phosphatase family protein [Kitasatospora hibisci]|uniref:SixA phosphatase family protein n=1 Tax=Kitasatospora hibisci TaxID=3369522 RepID=UPI0037543470